VKIKRNVARDRNNRRILRALGWKVLRFWEGEISRDPEGIAARIAMLTTTATGKSGRFAGGTN
jgi:G:T-mismatch repair DNA endonuclease (very short patch repair protein)